MLTLRILWDICFRSIEGRPGRDSPEDRGIVWAVYRASHVRTTPALNMSIVLLEYQV